MYCIHCGKPNEPGNKFCEHCGKPLTEPAPAAVKPKTKSGTSWVRRLPSIGGAVAFWLFFMPWVLVSCSGSLGAGMRVEASGYEIASGNYSDLRDLSELGGVFGAPTTDRPEADPVPALALIPCFGLLGLVSLNGRASGSVIAILGGVLGLIGLAIFTIGALSFGNDLAQGGFSMQLRVGYWGSGLAFIWQCIVGIMTIKDRSP